MFVDFASNRLGDCTCVSADIERIELRVDSPVLRYLNFLWWGVNYAATVSEPINVKIVVVGVVALNQLFALVQKAALQLNIETHQ